MTMRATYHGSPYSDAGELAASDIDRDEAAALAETTLCPGQSLDLHEDAAIVARWECDVAGNIAEINL